MLIHGSINRVSNSVSLSLLRRFVSTSAAVLNSLSTGALDGMHVLYLMNSCLMIRWLSSQFSLHIVQEFQMLLWRKVETLVKLKKSLSTSSDAELAALLAWSLLRQADSQPQLALTSELISQWSNFDPRQFKLWMAYSCQQKFSVFKKTTESILNATHKFVLHGFGVLYVNVRTVWDQNQHDAWHVVALNDFVLGNDELSPIDIEEQGSGYLNL